MDITQEKLDRIAKLDDQLTQWEQGFTESVADQHKRRGNLSGAQIATIDKIERENVVDHLWNKGASLKDAVSAEIANNKLTDVISLAGASPWTILAFKDHAKASKEAIKTLLLREMIRAGVLINASHNICFAHSPEDLGRVVGAYRHALPLVRGAIDDGDIERQLGNQVIRPIFTLRATPA